MGTLDGKSAIVTGAGNGIGQGIAIVLAQEGANVTVVDINIDGARETVAQIEQAGGTGLALDTDIRDSAQVEAAVAAVVEKFGTVDILVNNANATRGNVPFEDITDDDVDLTFATGPKATMSLMRAVFPHMKDGYGRIINVRSGSELIGLPGMGAYIAGKGAIGALSRVAAREWGKYGITVNCIAPSAMSPAAQGYFDANPDIYEQLMSQQSIPRFGDAQKDIGPTVAFLAGPSAAFVTGTTVSVDGAGSFYA
jgi:NAD(P)-dependent dehydrogenase (short-subunit alcohol dehydrogenase family)